MLTCKDRDESWACGHSDKLSPPVSSGNAPSWSLSDSLCVESSGHSCSLILLKTSPLGNLPAQMLQGLSLHLLPPGTVLPFLTYFPAKPILHAVIGRLGFYLSCLVTVWIIQWCLCRCLHSAANTLSKPRRQVVIQRTRQKHQGFSQLLVQKLQTEGPLVLREWQGGLRWKGPSHAFQLKGRLHRYLK